MCNAPKKIYRIVLQQYVAFLVENDIEYAHTHHLLQYRDQLRDKGFSSNWLHTQIVLIKGFYRHLRENWSRLGLSDIYLIDIAEQVRNPKVKARVLKKWLPQNRPRTSF